MYPLNTFLRTQYTVINYRHCVVWQISGTPSVYICGTVASHACFSHSILWALTGVYKALWHIPLPSILGAGKCIAPKLP